MRYQRDCSKITTLLSFTYFWNDCLNDRLSRFAPLSTTVTFGIGTNMLSLKSSGMYPDLYILLISLVIICIPFSPMHCSSSAETLSLPQAFPFGRSLITASISSLQIVYTSFSICIYLVLHIYIYIYIYIYI